MIPRLGLMAVSMVMVLTEAVLVCQYLWILRRELSSIDRVTTAFLKPAIVVALMAAVPWAIWEWPLVVIVTIAAVLYLSGIVLLGVIDRQETSFLRGLLTRRREVAVLE